MMETIIKQRGIVYRRISLFLLIALSFFTSSYAQDVGGVLVASENSQVKAISILEIRRVYLGLPSSPNSLIKKPIINLSDKETFKAFLKNIMHLTEKGYQRKLIKKIFRQGGRKVKEVHSVDELVSHLDGNPYDVSFMDVDTAKKTKGIKVLQVLW